MCCLRGKVWWVFAVGAKAISASCVSLPGFPVTFCSPARVGRQGFQRCSVMLEVQHRTGACKRGRDQTGCLLYFCMLAVCAFARLTLDVSVRLVSTWSSCSVAL